MKDRASDVEVLVGVNPVLEQLRTTPATVRRIFVASTAHGGARKVVEAANTARVPVVVEEPRRLARRAAGHVHQGVVAEIEPYRYLGWYDLLDLRPACVAALDQVTDPRNLGAILRVADAAGVGALIVLEHRAAGITPVAARAAAGAAATVPVARVTNLTRALVELRDAGYGIVGLDAGGEENLFGFRFPDPCVIVVGSEGRGLRPLVRGTCDFRVAVPMQGAVSSLNVSVAAAVTFYERMRQRQIVDTPSRGC